MRDGLTEQIAYWQRSSAEDFAAARSLYAKKHYPQCLFFCHLAVEKLLKALVVQRTGESAPFMHDLRQLAARAGLKVDADRTRILEEIFTFNIVGRYADAKLSFYRKYNRKVYAERYLTVTKDILVWLNGEFRNGS